MIPAETRSHRVNFLLRKALCGTSEKDLLLIAKAWGVTNPTAKNYIDTVKAKLELIEKGKT